MWWGLFSLVAGIAQVSGFGFSTPVQPGFDHLALLPGSERQTDRDLCRLPIAPHRRLLNAATLVVGRSGSAELAAPAYRFLDQDVWGNLIRLSRRGLLLDHSIYRQPVKTIFLKPTFKQ